MIFRVGCPCHHPQKHSRSVWMCQVRTWISGGGAGLVVDDLRGLFQSGSVIL